MNKYMLPVFVLSLIVIGVAAVYLSSMQTVTQERQKQEQQQVLNIEKETEQEETGPKGEDIIRGFFMLVNEKQIPGAFEMMTVQMVGGEADKTVWTGHFNALKTVAVQSIEPVLQESWTSTKHEYKVDVNVTVSPDSASAPVPYYGWKNGLNTRWVTVEKVNGSWKIAEIGTGQ